MIFSKSVEARWLHRGDPIELWSRCNRIYAPEANVITTCMFAVVKMNNLRRYYVCPSRIFALVGRISEVSCSLSEFTLHSVSK